MGMESNSLALVKFEPLSGPTADNLPAEEVIRVRNYLRMLQSLRLKPSPLTDQQHIGSFRQPVEPSGPGPSLSPNLRCLYKWGGFSISISEGETQDLVTQNKEGEADPIMFVGGVYWKPGMAIPTDGFESISSEGVLQDSVDYEVE